MLLAIDSGNTNTVFAVFNDAGEIAGQWRAAAKTATTADELAVWLPQLMALENLDRDDIDEVIIATVVPENLFDLRTLSKKYFGCDALVVGDEGVQLGVEVHVDRPDEVGADRLVNTVSAHQTYGGPLIVVDFGTATTFDVVSEDGAYEGGVIAPGVNLSLEALHMAAAALPHVDITQPQRVVGTNTVACMQSGSFWGYVGLIKEITARIRAERDRPMKVIATGGLAPLFQQAEDLFDTYEDDLTMHGLTVIHSYNKENP